jgi:hypothetical protein
MAMRKVTRSLFQEGDDEEEAEEEVCYSLSFWLI